MASSCKKCAGIIAATIFLLYCTHDPQCPYLHSEPHALEEFDIPTQYKHIDIVAVSSVVPVSGPSLLHKYFDPSRKGFTISLLDWLSIKE
jgi:hypothetical protein